MLPFSESTARVPGDALPALLDRIEQRERTARRRAVLYSLLPVALTIGLLFYTSGRVQDAQQELAALQVRVGSYEQQISDLQTQLADAERRLAEATNLSQYIRPINFVDAKELASLFPGSEQLLARILELRERGAKWKLGGQTPAEGFDSPSFAMYILKEIGAPTITQAPGESLVAASRRLYDSLPPTDQPRTGDLVFYPSGYALFYFAGRSQEPFVLGMTPFGITALRTNFARPVGYRQVRR